MSIAEYDYPPTIEERCGVSHAHGRVDNPILALGLVSVTERSADTLYRLKWSNDAKEYRNGVRAVFLIVGELSLKHSWDWSLAESEAAAEAVLRWWLCPICPSCCGRGANPVEGTPILDDGCPDCRGSGKRAYPWGAGRDGKRHTMTLWAIEETERRIRGKLIDKLAHQIRDAGALEK